jgi:hypothetical protein
MNNQENEKELHDLKFAITFYYRFISKKDLASELAKLFNFFMPEKINNLENLIITLENKGEI